MIASGAWDYTVCISDSTTGNVIQRITDHDDFISSIDWCSNGADIVITSIRGICRILSVATGRTKNTIVDMYEGSERVTGELYSVGWCPKGGNRIVCAAAKDENGCYIVSDVSWTDRLKHNIKQKLKCGVYNKDVMNTVLSYV
jgi:WD40 repeat protein